MNKKIVDRQRQDNQTIVYRLRWKVYKAFCWVAWHICPEPDRTALNFIYQQGLSHVKEELSESE